MILCRRVTTAVIVCLLVIAAASVRVCAQFEIVVFEFYVGDGLSEPWMGKALTDYSIRLLNGSGFRRAMPREEMRRLTMRIMPGNGEVPSFDNLDRIRHHANSPALIEGRLQSRRGGVDFIGTFIDIDGNALEDLSFTADGSDFLKLAELIQTRLDEKVVLENPGGFKEVAGTGNVKAFTANWKGVYLYESGDPARAVPLLEEAVKLDPGYREPYLTLGKILLEKADLNLAAEKFSKVVGIAPSDPRGHFLLGFAYHLMRKNDSAEKELLKALELYPGNPEYIYQLGVLYKSTFKYVESRDMFKKAVELDPSISDAWYQLASIYSNLEKESETIEHLLKAVEWGGRKVVARLENDSDFDWLRELPKFHQIMRMGK